MRAEDTNQSTRFGENMLGEMNTIDVVKLYSFELIRQIIIAVFGTSTDELGFLFNAP